MKVTRRTFIVGAGALAASTVLAKLLPSASDQARALPPLPQQPVDATDGTDIVFKIDGWSLRDSGARDEMWFAVNQSWRAVWR